MTDASSSEPAAIPRRGRLADALVRLFMRRAIVVGADSVAPGFRLITLASPQFKGIAWTAGQKVQIALGAGFATRTYTPIEWDATAGSTRLLAYAHGDGPGSDWVRRAKPGDACEVFGPRASLDVGGLRRPAVVFGDETSFALAATIARQRGPGAVRYLLEVNDIAAARPVLQQFDMAGAELFARRPHDAHVMAIEAQLGAPAAAGASFVLTGKAMSIQRLRRALKALDVPSARVMTKAYWAPGKKGLD